MNVSSNTYISQWQLPIFFNTDTITVIKVSQIILFIKYMYLVLLIVNHYSYYIVKNVTLYFISYSNNGLIY